MEEIIIIMTGDKRNQLVSLCFQYSRHLNPEWSVVQLSVHRTYQYPKHSDKAAMYSAIAVIIRSYQTWFTIFVAGDQV